MNFSTLYRLKADWKVFQEAHPKFTAFLSYCAKDGLQEGDVLDITVRKSDGSTTHANCRITNQDAQMLRRLQEALQEDQNGL